MTSKHLVDPDLLPMGRAETLVGLPLTFIGIGTLDLFVGENLRFARSLIRDGFQPNCT